MPPVRSAPSRRTTPHPGDLVGLHDARTPQIAVVEEVRAGKVALRIGWEGRRGLAPLRDLDAIATARSPAESLVVAGPSDPPWQLRREIVAAALPDRRELGSAWHLLSGEEGSTPGASGLDLTELAALLGSGEDVALRSALWLWLQGEQDWFRWRQQRAEARPLADIRLRRRSRRQQELASRRRRAWHGLLRARRPFDAAGLEEEARRELSLLEQWAAGACEVPLTPELASALQRARCPAESGAIRHLLVDLGQWSAHHLPSLERTAWALGFSPELEAEARSLAEAANGTWPGDGARLDLTALRSFTIDDEDTLDIDDALALEPLEGGEAALWIHIADPGRLIAPESPLDREARRRGSSLYLARGTLPMFPPVLANGVFSLRQGQRCPAWSLRVELGEEGEVRRHRLTRSWIRPVYRLSYGDADELIELAPPQEASLAQLHQLLERRRRWRLQRGGLSLEQAEGRIRSEGETASLQVVDPSPARSLVAEAMILVGTVVAELGKERGLALPYRSQPPAALPSAAELAQLEPGPVRHAALKRCLSRGHMGVTPAAHFSLGLEAYVQATSPIRRYGDLLVQRQLQALLEGTPAMDDASLAALLEEIEGPVREGIRISRDDQRHWQQVWFEQNHRPSWQGRFLRWLRPQDHLALVHLDDLCLELPSTAPAGCEPGASLRVRVVQVDSLRDQLRLQASL